MIICSTRHLKFSSIVALVGIAATALSSSSVVAQDTASRSYSGSRKISLVTTQAPIRDVLKLLFHSVGIDRPINPDIHGTVTVDINEVTFDTALHALLRSANPPVTSQDIFGPGRSLDQINPDVAAEVPRIVVTSR